MTIENLASMVKRGFDDVTKNMAKQRDLDLVRVDVHDIKEKLENIEKLTLKQYSFEIQELRKRVKRIEDLSSTFPRGIEPHGKNSKKVTYAVEQRGIRKVLDLFAMK